MPNLVGGPRGTLVDAASSLAPHICRKGSAYSRWADEFQLDQLVVHEDPGLVGISQFRRPSMKYVYMWIGCRASRRADVSAERMMGSKAGGREGVQGVHLATHAHTSFTSTH